VYTVNNVNKARNVEFQLTDIQYVVKTVDIDLDCQGNILLPNSAEQRAIVDKPIRSMIDHKLAQRSSVKDIGINKRS